MILLSAPCKTAFAQGFFSTFLIVQKPHVPLPPLWMRGTGESQMVPVCLWGPLPQVHPEEWHQPECPSAAAVWVLGGLNQPTLASVCGHAPAGGGAGPALALYPSPVRLIQDPPRPGCLRRSSVYLKSGGLTLHSSTV